jgi:(p)ppGpp synthase/HD superfamily hydrolase
MMGSMPEAFAPWSQERYLAAMRFAAEAHGAQRFSGTELPYLLHVALVTMEVVAALRVEPDHDQDLAVQCALLHDVVEDTPVGLERVREVFGPAVAAGVSALSKDDRLPKDAQLPDSLDRILAQPPEVAMVKLADRITNLQQPPGHWTRAKIEEYARQAALIHRRLGAASPTLAARLAAKIEAYPGFTPDLRPSGGGS